VLDVKDELPVTVIRPPAIYGPRDTEMFKFFQIVNNRVCTFLGSGDNRLSLIYAEDCARAIHLALEEEHTSGSVYFVEDGRSYSQREFAEAVERALGKRALKFSVPIGVVRVAALGADLYVKVTNKALIFNSDKVNELAAQQLCDGSRIRDELGFRPEVQLEEGAQRTVAWYREQGWL
jgi:nucleoside-diphosphate-sugar epimerase